MIEKEHAAQRDIIASSHMDSFEITAKTEQDYPISANCYPGTSVLVNKFY